MTKPNKEVKEELKQIIKSWEFATCPTETKEPFFWQWNEHGLEMLECYIRSLLSSERERIVKGIEKMKKIEKMKGTPQNILSYDSKCEGFNAAIDDILTLLKTN